MGCDRVSDRHVVNEDNNSRIRYTWTSRDTRVKPEYDDMVIQLLGYIISDRHIVTRNPVHCFAVNIDSTTKRHFGNQSAVYVSSDSFISTKAIAKWRRPIASAIVRLGFARVRLNR